MRGGQAVQRLAQQRFGQGAPEHERRLHAGLVGIAPQDDVAVSRRVQLRQAVLELRQAPRVEVRRVQVGGAALERVEEGARQGREDGGPAQQTEQGIDQRVLHVVHRGLVVMQVVARHILHRRRPGRARQRQVRAQQGGRAGPRRRLLAQTAP
ncbi:hypothetical protein D3C87_1664700 [compost metagenome]